MAEIRKTMKIKKFKLICCLVLIFFSLSSCVKELNNNKKAENLIDKMTDVDLPKFEDWQIFFRNDSLISMNYKVNDNYIGFLIKIENGKFLIKDKTNTINTEFIKLSEYPEEESIKRGLTKNKINEVVSQFIKSNASRIIYIKSFDGILISKNNIDIMFLLSDSLIDHIPQNYQRITDKWYYLPSENL